MADNPFKRILKVEIDAEKTPFVKPDGTYNMAALLSCGRTGGICYDETGDYQKLKTEPVEDTQARVDMTMNLGHQSIYDHAVICLNIVNLPKYLAMVLNNEKQYTTSERSLRYTPVTMEATKDGIISKAEVKLYEKWLEIFKREINREIESEGYNRKFYNNSRIEKLAQENARYQVTNLVPTKMTYTTTLGQTGRLAKWMLDFIERKDLQKPEQMLAGSMIAFVDELSRLNVLVEKLMLNEKKRSLSLFSEHMLTKMENFGNSYTAIYNGSLAQLAQAHRHRTIHYEMELLPDNKKDYFIPPVIAKNPELVKEWLCDIRSVANLRPQGELVKICEQGTDEMFILKTKESLCVSAQLEVMQRTAETLKKMHAATEQQNPALAKRLSQYLGGARCSFPDYKCLKPCGVKQGIDLSRKL